MSEILKYKEKPLVRRGNMIYYGNPEDPYIILLVVNSSEKVKDLEISKNISIILQEDNGSGKMIKKAEREGMYAAMDIAEYWLEDALSYVK